MNLSFSNKKILIISAICVLTFICFRYTLHNNFTNWDDDYYVTNDPYIKALTADNLKVIFTQDITKNNYHPLCMLSLAINYQFSQLNPQGYYLTNILIHIANVIFIFILMLQLCRKLKTDEQGTLFIASFCALWFGVHPMRVESVSWIAERKDVLYAFFYIAGLITYLQYIFTDKRKWYWITFVLFIASCLSKPMAVVFPMSLLCADVLMERKFSKKLIGEKVIFFAVSLICGGMAFYTQNKTGAVSDFGMLTIQERVMYAAYGFVMYISKLFNPTFLSTFYPYPYRYISGYLPAIYYCAPFLGLAVVGIPLYYTYKKNRAYFRIVAFGMGFFVANVIFILQFISVGAAIMADRYSYVAYIGWFFMAAFFLWEVIKRFPSYKTALISVLLLLSGVLSYLCYERTYAWHDSESLLTDAIEKYPYRALLSYKWLGNYYMQKGDFDKALENYKVLDTLHAADAKVLDNMGRIYTLKKNYPQAIGAFNNSQGVQNNVYKTYMDRCLAYSMAGDTLNAFKDYIQAFRLNPGSERILADSSFMFVQTQRFDAAIVTYGILLKLSTSNAFYYFYRGVAQFSKHNIRAAVDDWEIAVKLPSKDVQQSASYNLSVAYDSLGNHSKAFYYVNMAKEKGYAGVKEDYFNKLKEKSTLPSSAGSKGRGLH